MFRAAVLLFLASVVLAALALISCLSVEDRRRLRGLPRWAWVLVILLVPTLGPVAYFVAGRPLPQGRSWTSGLWQGGGVGTSRPLAPDDDPEFLRSLDTATFTSRDEEMLRRWEEDRKRREDDRRRNGDG
ncbi:MAG: PLD nuclease N-terminal domain-containing protein [Micromonosporaceae bacterium]|jgi:hypothetical protein